MTKLANRIGSTGDGLVGDERDLSGRHIHHVKTDAIGRRLGLDRMANKLPGELSNRLGGLCIECVREPLGGCRR